MLSALKPAKGVTNHSTLPLSKRTIWPRLAWLFEFCGRNSSTESGADDLRFGALLVFNMAATPAGSAEANGCVDVPGLRSATMGWPFGLPADFWAHSEYVTKKL